MGRTISVVLTTFAEAIVGSIAAVFTTATADEPPQPRQPRENGGGNNTSRWIKKGTLAFLIFTVLVLGSLFYWDTRSFKSQIHVLESAPSPPLFLIQQPKLKSINTQSPKNSTMSLSFFIRDGRVDFTPESTASVVSYGSNSCPYGIRRFLLQKGDYIGWNAFYTLTHFTPTDALHLRADKRSGEVIHDVLRV